MVFNVNKCKPFGTGLYVWDGQRWLGMNTQAPLDPPTLSGIPDTIHIASGSDKRVSGVQTINFTWTATDSSKPSWSNLIPRYGGGIATTQSYAYIMPASQEWAVSPASFSIYADDIPSVLPNYPWKTRESSTIISITSGACYSAPSKTVVLNQTNYGMVSGTSTAPIPLIKMTSTTAANLNIQTNVTWQATAAPLTTSVNNVLTTYTNANGVDLMNGSSRTSNFSYTGAPGTNGMKYKTALITFSDTKNRAKDIQVTAMQCMGSPDMSPITINATPAQTSGTNIWGKAIVRHQEKAGVYKEFYSADFNTAGRWMVTNLAATAYDGISHPYRTLTGPSANTSGADNVAIWAYPSKTSATTTTEFQENPLIGYLYSWDAATAGKGGLNGRLDLGDEAGTSHARVQGICPAGWHLPSDLEWRELENEIIKNTTNYADVASNIDPGDGTELITGAEIAKGRGKHGPAMKGICESFGTSVGKSTEGKSKHPSLNGFNVLLVGSVSNDFGTTAVFNTSSGLNTRHVRNRIVRYADHTVTDGQGYRMAMMSVRCKKD